MCPELGRCLAGLQFRSKPSASVLMPLISLAAVRGSVGRSPHCAKPRTLPDPEASAKGCRSSPNPQIRSKPSALNETVGWILNGSNVSPVRARDTQEAVSINPAEEDLWLCVGQELTLAANCRQDVWLRVRP